MSKKTGNRPILSVSFCSNVDLISPLAHENLLFFSDEQQKTIIIVDFSKFPTEQINPRL